MINFQKIKTKCPWREVDLWRHEMDNCAANSKPCGKQNCAIYQVINQLDPHPWPARYKADYQQTEPKTAKDIFEEAINKWEMPGIVNINSTPDYTEYSFITGGWAGNEAIIEEMKANTEFFRSHCFKENIGAGKYKFVQVYY